MSQSPTFDNNDGAASTKKKETIPVFRYPPSLSKDLTNIDQSPLFPTGMPFPSSSAPSSVPPFAPPPAPSAPLAASSGMNQSASPVSPSYSAAEGRFVAMEPEIPEEQVLENVPMESPVPPSRKEVKKIPIYASPAAAAAAAAAKNSSQGTSTALSPTNVAGIIRRVSGRKRPERKVPSNSNNEEGAGEQESPERRRLMNEGVGRHKSLVRLDRSRVATDPRSPQYITANRANAVARVEEGLVVEGVPRQKQSRRISVPPEAPTSRVQSMVPEKKSGSEDSCCSNPWMFYANCISCCFCNCLLSACGLRNSPMRIAWREKFALVSLIFFLCLAVGFLTFGFQQVVCGVQVKRVKGGAYIDRPNALVHGRLYRIQGYRHPLVGGIKSSNLLDGGVNGGGKDLSFMFQYQNSRCYNVITPQSGFGDDNNGVYNYFPCLPFDAYSTPNPTENYARVGCHDAPASRRALRKLPVVGDVYYDWKDLTKNGTNYIVYNGQVMDIGLLDWIVPWVDVPDEMLWFQQNLNYRGKDATLKLSSTPGFHSAGQCMQDILMIGYVESSSFGCLAADVVLVVSLFVIVGVVLIKFFLALLFGWVLSWKLGTFKEKTFKERQQRLEEIERWAEDMPPPSENSEDSTSTPPPNTAGGSGGGGGGGGGKSIFPTASRFTMPKTGQEPGRTTSVLYSDLQFPGAAFMQQGQAGRSSPRLPITPNSSGMLPTPRSLRSDSLRPESIKLSDVRESVRYSTFIQNPLQLSEQLEQNRQPFDFELIHSIMLVTCYSEGIEGMRATCNSLCTTDYPNTHKLLLVIADGMITGSGNSMSTPDICLSMMTDFLIPPDQVQPFSYVAIADGNKQHNMAKVYAGYYAYDKAVPKEKQQRVPVVTVVKVGNAEEQGKAKAGNRGKRDGQVLLMGFLQKVMFDERMTELEYELFNAIWSVSCVPPDRFESVLMVDADTKVYPDSLTRLNSVLVKDPQVMGLCGETKIANKSDSWVTMIQVFEYYIAHHLNKAFESVFGGVTCLPGCFCMYRIKAPKGTMGYWVPILANPDIVMHYAENVTDTLHKKNLLLLGEDRYLTTLMLRTFPKRKMLFVPQAVCKTVVPDSFRVLLSQRRRWINSTVHNLLELVLIRDLCGIFCFSMQFVVFIELIGTVVLPAAITFTLYLVVISFFIKPIPIIPLMLLAAILGLPAVLILMTTRKLVYVGWMLIYLMSLPVWNFLLPAYAFWHFDDFSWGETRTVEGEKKGGGHGEKEGTFDASQIVMKRWHEFEREKQKKAFIHLAAVSAAATAGGEGGGADDPTQFIGEMLPEQPGVESLGYPAPPTVAMLAAAELAQRNTSSSRLQSSFGEASGEVPASVSSRSSSPSRPASSSGAHSQAHQPYRPSNLRS